MYGTYENSLSFEERAEMMLKQKGKALRRTEDTLQRRIAQNKRLVMTKAANHQAQIWLGEDERFLELVQAKIKREDSYTAECESEKEEREIRQYVQWLYKRKMPMQAMVRILMSRYRLDSAKTARRYAETAIIEYIKEQPAKC